MATLILLVVVAYASFIDCVMHRIPNWLCLSALMMGLGLQVAAAEPVAISAMAASVIVPFLLFLPFYIGGGMAAGDVKLIASCGALLGWPAALLATGYALMAGTLMGIIVYVYRGGWSCLLARYGTALRMFYFTGSSFMSPADDNSVAKSRFPYALAIATGCAASVMFPMG